MGARRDRFNLIGETMYYNKKRANDQLENGVDNGADLGGDLFDFIEKIFAATTPEEIAKLKEEWEEE